MKSSLLKTIETRKISSKKNINVYTSGEAIGEQYRTTRIVFMPQYFSGYWRCDRCRKESTEVENKKKETKRSIERNAAGKKEPATTGRRRHDIQFPV